MFQAHWTITNKNRTVAVNNHPCDWCHGSLRGIAGLLSWIKWKKIAWYMPTVNTYMIPRFSPEWQNISPFSCSYCSYFLLFTLLLNLDCLSHWKSSANICYVPLLSFFFFSFLSFSFFSWVGVLLFCFCLMRMRDSVVENVWLTVGRLRYLAVSHLYSAD